MEKTPAAFFSYTHHDDTHDEGRLTELCKKLEGEIRTVTGAKFAIFQDKDAIKWGEQWKKRIAAGLGDATFLIAVVTPGYLRSSKCRHELEEFLKCEKMLHRDDLILPLLYVETPAVTDEARRGDDPLAKELADRQYKDWRDLRFEPWTNPSKSKRLHELACQIRDALERRAAVSKPKRQRTRKLEELAVDSAVLAAIQDMPNAIFAMQTASPAARKEPKTYVVDPMIGRGDFTSLVVALKAVEPAARILVRPGDYREPLVIDKPIEIVGDGSRDQITLRVKEQSVIKFATDFCRLANLTFRQEGGGECYGLNIGQGRPLIEDCNITSASYAVVAIHHGADPTLRRCSIHSGSQGGVQCYANGCGLLEDNDIFGNALSGVEIRYGANPTLRRNRIHDGKSEGILCGDGGAGLLEDNDIYGNAGIGVVAVEGGNPTLRHNRIHAARSFSGVLCAKDGAGLFEDNDIFNNACPGVMISDGANPILRRNRIRNCKEFGVFCTRNGAGLLENNDIYGNAGPGVSIDSSATPTLRMNRITKNGFSAIFVCNGGGGTFENNDLRGNAHGSWLIKDDCKDRVKTAANLEDPPSGSGVK